MVVGVMCLQEGNNIRDAGCKHLGPALAECKTLTILELVRDVDGLGVLCYFGCVSAPNSVFVRWWV